jgi:hypothetical protein
MVIGDAESPEQLEPPGTDAATGQKEVETANACGLHQMQAAKTIMPQTVGAANRLRISPCNSTLPEPDGLALLGDYSTQTPQMWLQINSFCCVF